MTDFSSLLDMDLDAIERPPAKPAGTYKMRVNKMPESTKSREKGTPGIEFNFSYVEAMGDVDPDDLEGVDITKGTARYTFWVTEDALFMLKEFLQKMGFETSGERISTLLPECVNREVFAYIAQQPRKKRDGTIDSEAPPVNFIESFLSPESFA